MCKRDVQSFIGVLNFHMDHMSTFALVAKPLYDIMRPSATFRWGTQLEKTFDELVCGPPEVGYIYSVGTDFCFRMPDLRRLDEEDDELMGSDVPTIRGTSACISEKNLVREAAASATFPVKPVTAEVRCVTLKRSSVSFDSRGSKKRKSREHECKLCSACTFISTPVRRHAVRHHRPLLVVPGTACWTRKKQYGSGSQLKKHACLCLCLFSYI